MTDVNKRLHMFDEAVLRNELTKHLVENDFPVPQDPQESNQQPITPFNRDVIEQRIGGAYYTEPNYNIPDEVPISTVGGVLQDTAVGLGQGVVDLGSLVLGTSNKVAQGIDGLRQWAVTGDINAVDMDNNKRLLSDLIGADAQRASEFIGEFYTDAYKQQQQELAEDVSNADGFVDASLRTLKRLAQSPNLAFGMAGQSAPYMFAGAGIGQGIANAQRLRHIAGIRNWAGGLGEATIVGINQAQQHEQATGNNFGLTEIPELATSMAGTALLNRVLNNRFNIENVANPTSMGSRVVDVGKELTQEYLQGLTESATSQHMQTGAINPNQLGQDAMMEAVIGSIYTAPPLLSSTLGTANKAIQKGVDKLSTKHEDLINPQSKKFNPSQAYAKAQANFNKATTDEQRQLAQQQMQEAEDSFLQHMDSLETQINQETDETKKEALIQKRQEEYSTYTSQMNAVKDAIAKEQDADFDVNSVIDNYITLGQNTSVEPINNPSVADVDLSQYTRATATGNNTTQAQQQASSITPHGFNDIRVSSVKDINHKFRMKFHNVSSSGGNSLFNGGIVKGDTLGFMKLLDQDDYVHKNSVGFTSITGGNHKKKTGQSHGNGYKIDLDLKGGDSVAIYQKVGQHIADLAKKHGYIVKVNAEKGGWGKIGKRGDVNFINGGGSHLDIVVLGRVADGQGGVISAQGITPNTSPYTYNKSASAKQNAIGLAGNWNRGNIGSLSDETTRRLVASTLATESNGGILNITELKGGGFIGKYQIGVANLEDSGYIKKGTYKSKGGSLKVLKDPSNWVKGMSYEKFMGSHEIQDEAFMRSMNRLYKYGEKKGYFKGKSQLEIAGMLKAGHIGGYGGLSAVATGREGKSDNNGTSAGKYYRDIASNVDGLDGQSFATNITQEISQEVVSTGNQISHLLDQMEQETNSTHLQELQEQVNQLQEQMANTQANQAPTQQETKEQEQYRAEQEENIVRRYSRLKLDDDIDTAKQEINRLQQAGVLSKDKAETLVSLLDIKANIKSRELSGVNSDIYIGNKKGNSNLETNLGLKDYDRVFTTGTPYAINKHMGYLERFQDSHNNKARLLQEAQQVFKDTGKVQYIGFTQENGWQFISKDMYDNAPDNSRVHYINANSTRLISNVIQEANDINNFTNGWKALLNLPTQTQQPVQQTQPQTVAPSSEVPVTNTAPVAPKPNRSNVDTSNVGHAESMEQMNDPNGVWVGRGNQNTVSLSGVENANQPFAGMFGNPFNNKQGNGWYLPLEQHKDKYKEKLAEYYSHGKKGWFRDEVEKLRGKKLYTGMKNLRSTETQAINEFLNETANMTDEQKLEYARQLASKGRAIASGIKSGRLENTVENRTGTKPNERSNQSNNSDSNVPNDTSNTIPNDTSTAIETSDDDVQIQIDEYDNNDDVSDYYDYLNDDGSDATLVIDEDTTQQTDDEVVLDIDDDVQQENDTTTNQEEEIDINKGKHELLDIIEHIEFNDTQLVIANAIANKYPDATISFDRTPADIIAPNTRPSTVLARMVYMATYDVLSNPTKSKAHEKVHETLDYVINQLSRYETTDAKDQELIQKLLESKEALVTLGTSVDDYVELLKSIKTKERKVRNNLFSVIIHGFMSFLGIPSKASTTNLYEVLMATSGIAIETQAKDNKSYTLSMVSDADTRKKEQDKPFYEQNLITSSFTQENKGNLTQVKSLSSRLIQKGVKEIKRLGVKEPNEKQLAQLKHFHWFEQEFKTVLYKSFKSKQDDYKYQDLKQFLNIGTNENPLFDDNTITALALSAYDYIAHNGGSSYTSAEDIATLIGVDDEVLIPNYILFKYKDAGISVNEVIIDLGKSAVKSLGLSAIDSVPAETRGRLEASLGDWILTTMLENNLAHKNVYNQQELEQDKAQITGKPIEAKESMATKTTITLKPREYELPAVTDIVNTAKGTSSYLSSLYGSDTRKRNVSLKPIEETIDKIDSTSSEVAKGQMEVIKRVQKEPMKLNQSMSGILDYFLANDTETLYDLIGAKVYTEEELKEQGVHISQRETKIKSAESNLRSLENYLELRDGLPTRDTVFYDQIKVVKNTRMHYNSNVFNFQSDKVHRALGEYADFETTLNTQNFVNGIWFDEQGNPTTETYFLRAVFENAEGTESIFEKALKGKGLSDGYTVDKLSSENFVNTAWQIINSKDVKTAVRGIHAIQDGKKPTQAQLNQIKNVVAQWDMGANSFRALVEVANLHRAIATNTPFVTSLGLGSDGVNNGTGIGMVQMGINDALTLQRLGMFKQDDPNQTYFDTRTDTSIGDYYTAFKDFLLGSISDLESNENTDSVLLHALKALNTSLEERKMLKAILIPFGYGAGNPRLIRASAEQMIKDIYATMTKITKSKDATGYNKLQLQLQAVLGESYQLPNMDTLLDYEFSSTEHTALLSAYESMMGRAISSAVKEYAGEFIQRRNDNIAIHNSISKTYIQAREYLLEQAKAKHEQNIRDTYKDASEKELERLLSYHTLSIKDIKEQVDIPLQKMFATVRTRHQTDDDETQGSIEFVKSEKTFRQDVSIKAITQVFNPKTKGLKDKTNSNVFIQDKNLVDTGVTPNSQMTQQQDAYVSSQAMVADGVVSINVHDANIGKLSHYIKMAMAQNKAFFYGTAKYHQYAESLDALLTTIENITATMGSEYVTSDVAIGLIESLITDIPNVNTTGELIQYVVAQHIDQGIGYDMDKLELLGGLSSVQQYAGEAGQYTVTDADRTMLKEQEQVLNEHKETLLKRLDKATKAFNHKLDFHSEANQPKPININQMVNYTGGAMGADTLWDNVGRQHGFNNHVHLSFQGHYVNRGITGSVVDEDGINQAGTALNTLLGTNHINNYAGKLHARSYLQVVNSDAVYAVAPIKGRNRVSGGTNTAVQVAIKLGKPVYVWDTNTEQWHKYQPTLKRFIPYNKPVVLTPNFAGIGTRDIENKPKQKGQKNNPDYWGDDVRQLAYEAMAEAYSNTLKVIQGIPAEATPSSSKQRQRETFNNNTYTNESQPNQIEVADTFTPELLKANPNKLYVFGDNLIRKGNKGQAIIRGMSNAIGLATKKLPSTKNDAYFSDDELSQNKQAIDNDIQTIKDMAQGRTIVFPRNGLGTGLADLANKAPRTWEYLNQRLQSEFGFNNGNTQSNQELSYEQAKQYVSSLDKASKDSLRAKVADALGVDKPTLKQVAEYVVEHGVDSTQTDTSEQANMTAYEAFVHEYKGTQIQVKFPQYSNPFSATIVGLENNGQITVKTSRGKELYIQFEDIYSGIPKEEIAKYQQQFMQENSSTTSTTASAEPTPSPTEAKVKSPYSTTPDDPIHIYVDGSDIKGTGRLGYGAFAEYKDKKYELSGTDEGQVVTALLNKFPDSAVSNPTMELLGLLETLKQFVGTKEHIVIHQDWVGVVNFDGLWQYSEGSYQRANKPWKPKEPYIKYIVSEISSTIEQINTAGGSVKILWVKGHSGNKGNNNADRLATSRDEFNTFLQVDTASSNDFNQQPNNEPQSNTTDTEVTFYPEVQLNESQQRAVDEIMEFVKDPNRTTHSLIGNAGSGKTTSLKSVLNRIRQDDPNKKILMSTPTHRANSVIERNMPSEQIITIASLTGKVAQGTSYAPAGFNKMPQNAILVIDESSMLDENDFNSIIYLAKREKTKVLFVGDDAQLAPVDSKNNADKMSPALTSTEKVSKLDKVMRAKNNELLSESTHIRGNQTGIHQKEQFFTGQTNINEQGTGVAFTKDTNTWFNKAISMFGSQQFKDNPLLTRIVAPTNYLVKSYNDRIRKALFGNAVISEGMIMMGYTSRGYRDEETDEIKNLVVNSGDYEVKSVEYGTKQLDNGLTIKGHHAVLTDLLKGTESRVFIVDDSETKQGTSLHNIYVNLNKLDHQIKQADDPDVKRFYAEQYNAEKRVLDNVITKTDVKMPNPRNPSQEIKIYEKDIDYGYAHTIHKSQGGTYNSIFVHDVEKGFTVNTRNRLRYVGISRAEDTAYVLSQSAKPVTGVQKERTDRLWSTVATTSIKVNDEVTHHVPSDLLDTTLPISQALGRIKQLSSDIPNSISNEFKSNLIWILDNYANINPNTTITFVDKGTYEVDVSKVSGRTRDNHNVYINTHVPSKDVDLLEVATHEIIHTVANPVLDFLSENVQPITNIQEIVRQATQHLQDKPRRLDYFLGTYHKDGGIIADVGVREVFTIGLSNEAVARVLRDIPMVSPKTGQPSNVFSELLVLFGDLVAYGHQQGIYRSEHARHNISPQRNQARKDSNREPDIAGRATGTGQNESFVPEHSTQGTNSQTERSTERQPVLPSHNQAQEQLNTFLWGLIKELNPNVSIEHEDLGDKFGGYYQNNTNTIVMNSRLKGDDYYKNLNHELYHALTETGLAKGGTAVEHLKTIHNNLKSLDDGRFADELKDINEFVAYVMTDKPFMDWVLDNTDFKKLGIPVKQGRLPSKLQQFVSIILNVFGFKNSNQKLNTLVYLVNETMVAYEPTTSSQRRYSRLSDATVRVNEMNITQVYKDLPTQVSDAHNEHLDSVIDNIIGTYKDTHKQQLVNPKQGKLKNKSLLNGYKTSDKEAYVTEALVTVFDTYIEAHKGTLAVNGLYKLFNDAQSQYPSASQLFPNFKQASKEDKDKMTKMYNFVFKNNSKQQSISRFMAMNLANEQFRQLMAHTTKPTKDNKSWFDKMMGVFEEIVNWFNISYFKAKSNTHKDLIDGMSNRLVELDIKARNASVDLLQTAFETSLNLSTKWLENPVKRAITKPLQKIAGSGLSNANPIKALANVYVAVQSMEKTQEMSSESVASQLLASSSGLDRYNTIRETLNELTMYGSRGKWIDMVVRLTQGIGRLRQSTSDATKRVLNGLFETELTQQQKTHITQAVIRIELSALLRHGFGMDKIKQMFDKNKRHQAIDNHAKQLIDRVGKDVANDMLIQAKILGFYMANERTGRNLTKSAQGIAIGLGTEYETTFDRMDKEVYQLVDIISTLYAMDYTTLSALNTVKALFESEPNAMQTILHLHKGLVDKSADEFSHNPLNYQKGYTPFVANPYRKIVWATTTDEINHYKAQGFEIINSLGQDALDNTEQRTLMLHTAYAPNKRVSGGLDMADTHARGTVIYEQGYHDGDIARVAKANVAHRKQRNKGSYKDYDPNQDTDAMVAIYDTDGAILSYHYEMAGDTKDAYLERDNSFDEMLGRLHGNLLFQKEMRQQQASIAKQVFKDAKENFAKNPDEFVVLDFDSHDPNVQEVMKLLPYAFRQEIISLFGDGVVPIHKSIYTSMFGFRAYSIANMFDKLHDPNAKFNYAEKLITGLFTLLFEEQGRQKAVNTEKLMQDFMSTIKDYIVVRSGGVLVGNIMSNTLLLMLHGINPVKIIKDSIFAWRNSSRYVKTQTKVDELNVQLLGLTDTKKMGHIKRQINSLQKELENNPMHEFMKQGLMSTIVEDLANQDDKYQTPLQETMNKYLDKIPKSIRNTVGTLTLDKGTVGHNFLSQATQFSDLSAKYVLAKYQMDKGKSLADSIYEAQISFINYDMPTNPFLDYMNRMGFMLFTKFFLRFQQVMLKMFHKLPITAMAQHYAVEMMGGQGIFEPFIFNRFGNPFDGSIGLADDAFMGTVTADMVRSVF